MRALILVAGAALALSACHKDEPAPVAVDIDQNGVVTDADNVVLDKCGEPIRRGDDPPKGREVDTACN